MGQGETELHGYFPTNSQHFPKLLFFFSPLHEYYCILFIDIIFI